MDVAACLPVEAALYFCDMRQRDWHKCSRSSDKMPQHQMQCTCLKTYKTPSSVATRLPACACLFQSIALSSDSFPSKFASCSFQAQSQSCSPAPMDDTTLMPASLAAHMSIFLGAMLSVWQ